MGRRRCKSSSLPELEDGDVFEIAGQSSVFGFRLKSGPALVINGEIDLKAVLDDLAASAAQVLQRVVEQKPLDGTPFSKISTEANSNWIDSEKGLELSKVMAGCTRAALSETVVLTLKRMKGLSERVESDFICFLVLHMEENGLLKAEKGARAKASSAYISELARSARMEMELDRAVRPRNFTPVWRRMVLPVYDEAVLDFHRLRKEHFGRARKRAGKNRLWMKAWTAARHKHVKYGSLLDSVESCAPRQLALKYVQRVFDFQADAEAIYDQIKTARLEREKERASSGEAAFSEALDKLVQLLGA